MRLPTALTFPLFSTVVLKVFATGYSAGSAMDLRPSSHDTMEMGVVPSDSGAQSNQHHRVHANPLSENKINSMFDFTLSSNVRATGKQPPFLLNHKVKTLKKFAKTGKLDGFFTIQFDSRT